MLELTDSFKALVQETAERLQGHERRRLMAQTVKALGSGGQRLAERALGWNRGLIRQGKREVESGIVCVAAFALRGRRLSAARLPNLLAAIKSLVDSQSQTDPKFKTRRLDPRWRAAEVHRQRVSPGGYSPEALPSAETMRPRLNQWGYYPSKVGKTKPQKKSLDRCHF